MSPSVWALLDYRRPGQNPAWDYAVYIEGQWIGDLRKLGNCWQGRTPAGTMTARLTSRRSAGYQLHQAHEEQAE